MMTRIKGRTWGNMSPTLRDNRRFFMKGQISKNKINNDQANESYKPSHKWIITQESR